MAEAVEAYRQVSTTEEFMMLERMREDARCIEATALAYARREEKIEIAKAMLANNMDVNTIAEITDLSVDEILNLK